MAEAGDGTDGRQAFVESMGLYFERYGVARIGGRLLGLLMLADRPLTQEAMAAALGVSRASVSTNVRLVVESGLVEVVSLPGDRRDYYRFAASPWERGIVVNVEAIERLRRISAAGLAAVPPDDVAARERLLEALDFCDFMLEEYRGLLVRWRARLTARRDGGARAQGHASARHRRF
jgi:hypothetical protein